jgi:hypothetical protein
MIVYLNNKKYIVSKNEFNLLTNLPEEICNLKIVDKLGLFERLISLIKELSKINKKKNICIFFNQTHGGYISLECSSSFDLIYIINSNNNIVDEHNNNISRNIQIHDLKNIFFLNDLDNININSEENYNYIIFSEKYEYINENIINKLKPIILTNSNNNIKLINYHPLDLTNTNYSLFVPNVLFNDFYNSFYYFMQNLNTLNYDNLIHLCIMVKNAGEQFEETLLQNLDLIDRWTILDTGSTDNTINAINKVLVGKKKGELFREPFINFRDSRNRLLELAGEQCKFTLMLDDTYVVKGNLKDFFNEIRGDQYSDSFSLSIKNGDYEYTSNRILKTHNKLRYLYKIHEVIQTKNNINVIVPKSKCIIYDNSFDYMDIRTMNRKKDLDLKLLFEELEEDPENSRTYYYLAETYYYIENYERAYYYYIERMKKTAGFSKERTDAIVKASNIANYILNKPWSLCEDLYLKAHSLDNKNSESLFHLGLHYYKDNNKLNSYMYLKKCFDICYTKRHDFLINLNIDYYLLPTILSELCYFLNDNILGEQVTKYFLQNNYSNNDIRGLIISWHNIFLKLNTFNLNLDVSVIENYNRPLLCFVADGGFEPWTGSDILIKGVGGSETYIIEMARYIQKQGFFKVIVFCNCLNQSVFENVEYIPIINFGPFIKNNVVHSCIISRFSEYIPLAITGNTKNIYFVLHDVTPSGIIIPINNKIKNIFCLSEWHVNVFLNNFPQFEKITVLFYYGIDVNKFNSETKITKNYNTLNNEINQNINIEIYETIKKVPFKFIYSSFPNRGLFQLLQMWIKIVSKYPDASLHIYSDIQGKWVNDVVPELMKEIKNKLDFFNKNSKYNVFYYGWVNKDTLAEGWKTSDIWFYPCTFAETFCLTALEAALSKTLVVTNGFAALKNTAIHGICIEGNPITEEWQEKALTELFSIMENKTKKEKLVELNYNWASKMSWKNQATKLLEEFLLKN